MTELTKSQYEADLKLRQEAHLLKIEVSQKKWAPCLHDECLECHGTAIKIDGKKCVHNIVCPCPKCITSY